ncbi:Guanine nucleotide exchange factor (GEF) which may activate RAB8A and RAB8B [Haplosporangium sp. Z 27]|nr:Guanine nucleotide exchange factor (GEF) which may activate RAB8A and RAB8B [Haplosporangium sp. Z 27]
MNRLQSVDTRKGRDHALPPLDTTRLFKKPMNHRDNNNDPLAAKTSTPTTALSSSTTIATASVAQAPWKRSRDITHIASFPDDNILLTPSSPSCFPPTYLPYYSKHNTGFSPAVNEKEERSTRRLRSKTSATISIPSFESGSISPLDKIRTSFAAAPRRRSKSSDLIHRYESILSSQRQHHQQQHQQELGDQGQFQSTREGKTYKDLSQSPDLYSHLRTMPFWDSLNSASTCVDSPTRTYPTTAKVSAVDRMSDLYAKCQQAAIQENNRIQRIAEVRGIANNYEDGKLEKNDDRKDSNNNNNNNDAGIILEGDKHVGGFTLEGEQVQASAALKRDIEVMSWLGEAIQTVSLIEARLVEQEADSQLIPQYEEDKAQMIQVIQELDNIVRLDQAWMENTEKAVRWTSYALEEALLSSYNTQGHGKRNYKLRVNSGTVHGCRHRRTRSEDMLPLLGTVGTLENSASVDLVKSSGGSSVSEKYDNCSQRSLSTSVQQQEGLESIYRNAIITALRHLKTIERSQTSKSEITNIDTNNKDGNSTKKTLPNLSLEKWLENASMISLSSIKCDHQSNDSRNLATEVDDNSSKIDLGDGNHDPCGNIPLNQPRADGSEDKRDLSLNPSVMDHSLYPEGPLMESIPSQVPTQSGIPNLSTSSASFHATISGSSHSLQTELGGCLMDERVYLKQYIQALDRLRVQEQERNQRAEKIHHQLISDLERFSKELIHSVNDLTCAQAALDEAREFALMTFNSIEDTITYASSSGGSNSESKSTDSAKKTKRMIVTSTKALEESMSMVEQGAKRMRALAADCVGITEFTQDQSRTSEKITSVTAETTQIPLSTLSEPSIRTSLTVPVTDFSRSSALDPITARNSHSAMSISSPPLSVPTPGLDQKTSSLLVDGIAFQEFEGHLASLRSTLGSISKKFLNNSINNRAKNSLAGTLIVAPSGKYTIEPSSPLPQLLSSAMSSTIEMTPFMKRVLAEDIYPCLLTHPRPVVAKQSGWMSSLLYSSASTSTPEPTPPIDANSNLQSTYIFSQQTPWFQRLLKAMERNACEIEFWKINQHDCNRRQRQDSSIAIAVSESAPKVSCCLCGIVRPCEFKLRFVDNDSSVAANTKHSLDRFCRDRIVAVCDFYMFLAHLRQGLLDNQSDLELFRKALWLRQRMGCARIGSIDIVQKSSIVQFLEASRE